MNNNNNNNPDHLSLVSEVAAELKNSFGFEATARAQGIIDIGRFCDSPKKFISELKHQNLRLPNSVAVTVWEAIHRAAPLIHFPGDSPRTDRPEVAELNRVYKGKVFSIRACGFFVKLDGFSRVVEGLVNNFDNEKVNKGQEVYVKVLANHEKFLSLSMKDVDQRTGRDLSPPVESSGTHKDCIKIGEEATEIEVNEKIPAFLKYFAAGDMSPVKIFKDPNGSLSRGAASQYQWFEELREGIDQTGLFDSSPNSIPAKRPSSRSIEERRAGLPIFEVKKEIVEAVKGNQVVIVVGETGSGKTTQLTQYLAEAGYRKIGCSQPWRTAAISAAQRVAEELSCEVGEAVGYAVHLESRTGPNVAIEYVTEDELLRQVSISDYEAIARYSVLVIDEAQERAITTDVLFSLMKNAVLKERADLRLVVASSNAEDSVKFSAFFSGMRCCVVAVPLRTFPVEIVYEKQPMSAYIEAAILKILEIYWIEETQGDIIIFLTSPEEIDYARESLHYLTKAFVPKPVLFPVYNPGEAPPNVFDPAPPGQRKVILANASPEGSSLTAIDGVSCVVDPGFARLHVSDPKLALDSIVIAPISQASARQRASLAGRSGPGKCYRLYTERAFLEEMWSDSAPDIRRRNLIDTALRVKAKFAYDVLSFEFVDWPCLRALGSALRRLYGLGALDEDGLVTELGKYMVQFTLDPALSKMLLAGVGLGCGNEVLTVISMSLAASTDVFHRPRDRLAEADQKRVGFSHPDGDHLTLLALFEAWKAENYSLRWCSESFVRSRSLCKALKLRDYLKAIMAGLGLNIVSAGEDSAKIRKAITAGLFFHAARKDPQSDGYRTLVGNQMVHIHPSSVLYQRRPSWVVYNELDVNTREREYMRNVTAIDPNWLVELAPRFFKVADPTRTRLLPARQA